MLGIVCVSGCMYGMVIGICWLCVVGWMYIDVTMVCMLVMYGVVYVINVQCDV